MAGTRDDFSTATTKLLAQRAGYMCAQPDCRQLTVGPSEDRVGRVTMVGVAAHITAASPGGPRFDASLTPQDRAAEANGLWVCQTHGKMIDDTASQHTVATLRRWKTQHEEWVFQRVASADSVLKHGLTGISIANVGPLRDRTAVPLGRHNVVFGNNNTGKSSLCECIAAFAGGVEFEGFRRRWRLFGPQSPNMSIEAAVSIQGVRTTVRLGEEASTLRHVPLAHRTRLHVEVAIYENPLNGWREAVPKRAWLWMLLFGGFYMAVRGLWRPLGILLLVLVGTSFFFWPLLLIVAPAAWIYCAVKAPNFFHAHYARLNWDEIDPWQQSDE